ncbi:MAG: glutamine-hydrolyzing carbamoyl-phosphate synthase small subunit [Planctomycetota bacterium]
MSTRRCYLGLEDGTVFTGRGFGAHGTTVGEVVFNTAMCGYQEILTDPSYCGQIVTMTAPLIGNYGINPEDLESSGQHLSGFVVKELSRRVSNHRASGDLDGYLRQANVIGLSGIDTRSVTKRLRERGALRGVISTEISDPMQLVARAKASPEMSGQNLVEKVKPTTERVYQPSTAPQTLHVVAIDCGIKENIIRHLTDRGCSVRVVPSGTSADAILSSKPDGVLAGNGPGDPAAVTDTIEAMRSMIGRVPIFGICLGHQLLSLALGAKTYKLKFGHHGANHPVLNTATGRVEITSQNHGFAVDVPSLEAVGGRVTHVNLYDQSLEGFAHPDRRVFAVQYHPEAAPGPHDSGYLFQQFVDLMRGE